MKLNQLITAGALALAFTGVASAQTVIRISGATAFRAATQDAIRALMPDEVFGYAGTNFGGTNRSVFSGTVNGQAVVISCRWSGSVGGLEDLALDRTYTDWPAVSGSLTAAGTQNYTVTGGGALTSDIALSDTFPSSVGITGNPLTTSPVGVVPFFFVKGKSNNAAVQTVLNKITNINILQAQSLLAGQIAASQLTGDEADVGVALFPVGRDAESGTRAVTFAETAFGVFGVPGQVKSTISGGQITGVTVDITGGGYSSNSFTATDLKTPISATATVDYGYGSGAESGIDFGIIAYIGLSDIVNTSNNLQSQVLAYNGTQIFSQVGGVWTPNWDLLYSGKYTLWGYENISWRTTLAGTKLTVANSLKAKIKDLVTAPSGLLLTSMNVERAIEGGPISHK